MKKLIVFVMVAAALTIFNGCQKDELGVIQQANDVQPQEVVQPDVYVENEYLVFKSQEVFDSTLVSCHASRVASSFRTCFGICFFQAEMLK